MASGSAMGRAMMRAALAGSKSSPAHRRLLHGSPSHRTSTSKEEVDILLDRLKETGTKSMDMATLDQTLDSVNSALSGAMARRAQRAYVSIGVVIIGFTVGAFSATPASYLLSE